MTGKELDISSAISWEEGLPRPQWDLLEMWIDARFAPDARHKAWVMVGRQWLAELGRALGREYEVVESDHFLALVTEADATGRPLLLHAEKCRAALLSGLSGVAGFEGLGNHVVVALRNQEDYYRYISHYYPEGEHGGSGGIQIREGYSHVALNGKQLWVLENSLAHELTHLSLQHRSMPQWLEEGLAQMFEHDMTGRSLLEVDEEMAGRHKRYWRKHGLAEFWGGEGFSRAGAVQELSYQLAEILTRLLFEESRPRWFGWVREPQRRFFAFLQDASVTDCGEAACQEHLGFGLSDLPARFLGPGSWFPSL